MNLRLVLDVEYDASATDAPYLIGRLDDLPRRAAGDGLLTGDADAEVLDWSHRVEEVGPPTPCVKTAPATFVALKETARSLGDSELMAVPAATLRRMIAAVEALCKCEAILAQMQDRAQEPDVLQAIVGQGYYGQAIESARRALTSWQDADDAKGPALQN